MSHTLSSDNNSDDVSSCMDETVDQENWEPTETRIQNTFNVKISQVEETMMKDCATFAHQQANFQAILIESMQKLPNPATKVYVHSAAAVPGIFL